MSGLTPAEALRWLSANDSAISDSYGAIVSAQAGLNEYPPGSAAYQENRRVMDYHLARVEQAQQEQAFMDAGVDPAFAGAACDCAPGEPCCLRAFEVRDKSDSSRLVSWPIPDGGPRKLFLIAKDPYQGSPSGEVDVVLTDYEPCKNSIADRQGMNQSGFADAPPRFAPDNSAILTATMPFHIPAALSALFSREILMAIYVAGYYILYSSYRSSDVPKLWPFMCMLESGGDLIVHPVPHLDLTTSISGAVSARFFLDGLPQITSELSGSITGEIASETISYTAQREHKVADRRTNAAGPVRNPFLGTIAKIYEKVSWMSEEGARGYAPSGGIPDPTRSSITLRLGCELELAKLQLKGKGGSPDLELTVDPMRFRITLGVTGKMDLLDLLISRVPGISDSLREAREALGREGNILSAQLRCELILSAEGGVEAGLQSGATITIGSQDGWEAAFDTLRVRFQADAKITGKLEVMAQIGVDTWFFDGTAGAEGTVSTGWHFGGRKTDNGDGTQTTETLYYFEGLRLRGRYYVRTGAPQVTTDRATFPTGSDDSTGTTTTTTTVDNNTRLIDREFTASFFASEGGPDDWREVE